MKLSIVIPIYRVEATLDRCIESVVSQDYTNFEVILVDDGSPDRCPQKCDEWALRDNRIRVIHKPNGGLSDARNAGIRQAQGDYITFLDSDDYIAVHTYLPLMDYLTLHPETDIIEYPASILCGSPHEQQLRFKGITVYRDMEKYWYQCEAYQHSYAWNKLYRAALFDEVSFPVGMVFEDIHTLFRLLQHTDTLVTIDMGCYYYCYNPQGITATADGEALRMHLQHHIEILRSTIRRDALFQAYYMQVLNIQIDVYDATGDDPILPLFSVNPSFFKGARRIKASILNHLGINNLCRIFKLTHKIWRNR